jgi:hypothetical protein
MNFDNSSAREVAIECAITFAKHKKLTPSLDDIIKIAEVVFVKWINPQSIKDYNMHRNAALKRALMHLDISKEPIESTKDILVLADKYWEYITK